MKKQFLQSAKVIILGSILGVGISYAFGAWTPPPSPPPDGNTEPPINVSSNLQGKIGSIIIGHTPAEISAFSPLALSFLNSGALALLAKGGIFASGLSVGAGGVITSGPLRVNGGPYPTFPILRTTAQGRVGLGTNTPNAVLDVRGGLHVGKGAGQGRVTMGTEINTGNATIELEQLGVGNNLGTPFIDFVNDAVTDADARIILEDDDTLGIEGGFVRINSLTNSATTLAGAQLCATPEGKIVLCSQWTPNCSSPIIYGSGVHLFPPTNCTLPATITATITVVGGGGGGGGGSDNTVSGRAGGGGGGGGTSQSTITLNTSNSYTVTVGVGGSHGGTKANGKGGGDSSFAGITAGSGAGGGGGGSNPGAGGAYGVGNISNGGTGGGGGVSSGGSGGSPNGGYGGNRALETEDRQGRDGGGGAVRIYW